MSSTQKQEDNLFDMAIMVKKLAFSNYSSESVTGVSTATASVEPCTVKLPKIDVPTFDGELLHWQTFWEQFGVSLDK